MMKGEHLSRTTNVGLMSRQGIALGVDARITISYKGVDDKLYEEIKSDEEVKTFQLCSNPLIFCTLMGDVEEWHEMYRDMLRQAPKSVKEAFDIAENYLQAFKTSHRRNKRIDKIFGTLIAGYQKEKGFEVLGISLEKKNIVTKFGNDNPKALGSGATYAEQILFKGQNWNDMTKDEAINLAFEALLHACLKDVYSGGKLTVTFVHEDGIISETYYILEVYNRLYDLTHNVEKKTLFLLYSTHAGPIFGDDAVQDLISDVWPGLTSSSLTQSNHLIAKTACFYVHYIVFKTEQAATRAYVDVPTKNGNPHFPQPLADIRSFLTNCVRESTRDHVYIGRSSKGLLEGLCKLENAPNLKY
ncbi:hypothetical protein M0R45_002544 [Rubus argutus]|uniref:Uncharacterized protein n=1 Tax=Rubus argutus TaxID=59490 RepID=A0AAW1VR89_RUBAR